MWRTIPSLLKAQAIKSISAPFPHTVPEHNTNCRTKQCRLLRLKTCTLLSIRSVFIFYMFSPSKRQDKSEHLYSVIQSSGDYCVHHVWPVVSPHRSPYRLPAPAKSSGWPEAWLVPIVSCCSPSVLSTSLWPL